MNKISMKDFMRQTGVSRATIYSWIKKGIVSDQKFGGRRMFDDNDLLNAPSVLGKERKNDNNRRI